MIIKILFIYLFFINRKLSKLGLIYILSNLISYIILKYLKSFVIIFAILIICFLLLIKILFELVLHHKNSLLQVKEENEKFSLFIFFSFKLHLLIIIASNLLRLI